MKSARQKGLCVKISLVFYFVFPSSFSLRILGNYMRLNLGSHNKRIEGFTNVDVLDLPNVDYICDITDTPFIFKETNNAKYENKFDTPATEFEVPIESIDEIVMTEVLEHISFRKTNEVLKECHRILKNGGKLSIQVPDIREMMFAYWNGQICSCVPHKPKDKADGMAKLDCPNCHGYGRVNPTRWLYAFTGAQKHEWDIHRNIFTPEILEENLENAGFNKIDIGFDEYRWKIKARAIKD